MSTQPRDSVIGDIGKDILTSPQVKAAAGGILAALLDKLIGSLIDRIGKIGSKPSHPADPPIDDNGDDDTDVVTDKPKVSRRPAELRANYSGITRKKNPYAEGGGRVRVGSQEFRRIVSGQDPLQAGDVVDINITPYDQFGKPFLPGEGVNNLLLRPDGFPGFRHNISGKAYLVREAPKESDPFGCTPGLRVPSTFQDEEVRPGYEGTIGDEIELHLDENGKAVPEDEDGDVVLKVTLPTLRVKPWAA